ncbi:MAG: hypothetical protein GY800_04685 [Planctomycetes bacterium]|nr:hypothetical protein [Planctomycetota bacterium]
MEWIKTTQFVPLVSQRHHRWHILYDADANDNADADADDNADADGWNNFVS